MIPAEVRCPFPHILGLLRWYLRDQRNIRCVVLMLWLNGAFPHNFSAGQLSPEPLHIASELGGLGLGEEPAVGGRTIGLVSNGTPFLGLSELQEGEAERGHH